MTPQEAIAALDAALSQAGERITLRRPARAGGQAMSVSTMAFVRGYNPSDLIQGSGITQQDQKLILSPTALVAAGWPGGSASTPVPTRDDRVSTTRGVLTVVAAAGIYMQSTLVRLEMQVRGA